MLICWLGAGGPHQKSFVWLSESGLAKTWGETTSGHVTQLYEAVKQRVDLLGWAAVFDGDSRAVKFRLDSNQQGENVVQEWFKAVPGVVAALESGMTPSKLEQTLRSIHFVGELTAKEIFVHLAYVKPQVADTTRHIAVGPGAREGALIVLRNVEAVDQQSQAQTLAANNTDAWRKSDDLESMRRILALQPWALHNVPRLSEACREYRANAPHRLDPLCNYRLQREYLFDLADVEVMLCYFKNYHKIHEKHRDRQLPPKLCPRGWERRKGKSPCA